jgi:transcriptional regulator with XRE-family HTH domain
MNEFDEGERRNDELAEKIASTLRDLRVEKNMTQDELAGFARLSRTSLGDVEQARKAVTVQKLLRIVSALDVTLSEFFERLEQSQRM